MRHETSEWAYAARRPILLAWTLVALFLVLSSMNPQSAAAASTLQLHGALHREDSIGVISHRGAAALAPENTLAAMQVAIDQGVEFVEADVQLTADDVPVLMHDPTVDRTTNGSGPVAAHTLKQIKKLDAGRWFDREYKRERVPTLVEFFDLLETSTARALIELKGEWVDAQIEAVIGLMRERHLVHRVALQSFEVPTLELLQTHGPEFARVLLTREWDERVVDLAVSLQASAVGARLRLFDERPDLLEPLRRVGIGSLAYTLNRERTWRAAADIGVDLVVTDDPVSLVEWTADALERV